MRESSRSSSRTPEPKPSLCSRTLYPRSYLSVYHAYLDCDREGLMFFSPNLRTLLTWTFERFPQLSNRSAKIFIERTAESSTKHLERLMEREQAKRHSTRRNSDECAPSALRGILEQPHGRQHYPLESFALRAQADTTSGPRTTARWLSASARKRSAKVSMATSSAVAISNFKMSGSRVRTVSAA